MKRVSLAILLAAVAYAASSFASLAPPTEDSPWEGTVEETMTGGRYTYVRLEVDGASEWVASSQFEVQVGDRVAIRGGTPMKNFESPTLNRTFESILFADSVQVGDQAAAPAAALPPGHPPVSGHGGHGSAMADDTAPGITGEIIETMDAGSYTYVRVRSEDRTAWAATDRFEARVGARVTVPGGMLMKNFESPTLHRTFDEIYFADRIEPADDAPASAPAAPHSRPSAETASVAPGEITLPPGALSVAEIFARRAELAGQDVAARGRVVKYTARVLDRNWLHLADGTGEGEARDLTVSTTGDAAVGDVVTIRGRVAVDKDLGMGYQYPVLIEDATLSAE